MKHKIRLVALPLLVLLFAEISFAQQDPAYEVQFTQHSIDCENRKVYIDLEVKALAGSPSFYISDQNYRISYNRAAVSNPSIAQELELSGTITSNNPTYIAYFDPHHLGGSLDTVISYNVVLAGGHGYPIDDTRWYPVGRLEFDINDDPITGGACLELWWHSHAPIDYPPTFIGEKRGGPGGVLLEVGEDPTDPALSYNNLTDADRVCFPVGCPILPVTLSRFAVSGSDCSVELNWRTEAEYNSDFFVVERSYDAVQWSSLSERVAGSGTSSTPREYHLQDLDYKPAKTLYYRLVQFDLDGGSQVLDQAAVQLACDDLEFNAYPNPASSSQLVAIDLGAHAESSSTINLHLYDSNGRRVRNSQILFSDDLRSINIPTEGLRVGVYMLVLENAKGYLASSRLVILQ